MDDEGFIFLEVIFDTAHPLYKDNSKKDKAWAEIAQKFGVEGG